MKAMILAAGRGERMRPLTDVQPKPLLLAGGEPLIVWHIRRLAAAGIHQLVINHAWLGEKLVSVLGDGSQWGVHIEWSAEAPALETAGGIAKALPLLGDEPFIVVNGDVLCDFDCVALRQKAVGLDGRRHAAYLLLVDNPPHQPAGDFSLMADGRVQGDSDPAGDRVTFAGIASYHPVFFEGVRQQVPAQLPLRPLLIAGMAAGQIQGEKHRGIWIDVGTPERLAQADQVASQWSAR